MFKLAQQFGYEIPINTNLDNEFTTKVTDGDHQVHEKHHVHIRNAKEVKKVNEDLWGIGSQIENQGPQFSQIESSQTPKRVHFSAGNEEERLIPN